MTATDIAPAPIDAPEVSLEDSARSHSKARNRSRVKAIIFHVCALLTLAVILYPAVWMLMASFKPSAEIIGSVNPFAGDMSFDNFVTAFEGIGGVSFWTFILNSLGLAVLSVLGVTLSCSITAYAFARITFPGRGAFFVCMIMTLLLPFHVVIIPQYILFNQMGMIDTWWPLLLGKFLAADAFFVFLMVQFVRGLPRDLDEAARIDGAGHYRIFWSVILPLMKPALVTSSIFAFIWSWNDFFGPLLYLKSPDSYTMPLALRLYVDQTTSSNYGAQMAMTVLALIPVVLFFLAFQRYIVDGVATQGLKG